MALISDIYSNKNRTPVDFQAVKSFFLDHESVYDPVYVKSQDNEKLLDISFFYKPANGDLSQIKIDTNIEISDYLRVCMSLKRINSGNRPKTLRKLTSHCRSCSLLPSIKMKKYTALMIKELETQKIIKIVDHERSSKKLIEYAENNDPIYIKQAEIKQSNAIPEGKVQSIVSRIINTQNQLKRALITAEELATSTTDKHKISENVRIDIDAALEALKNAEISASQLLNNISSAA